MNNRNISATVALEYPFGEYMKVLVNRRETILNKQQTIIWRELRKHEAINTEVLFDKLQRANISKEDFDGCINAFIEGELAILVESNW